MLPSGVQPQPPRQPSEAAYGCSGRTREVGAILRCVLTSYATAARPHPCDANLRLSPVSTRWRRQAVTSLTSLPPSPYQARCREATQSASGLACAPKTSKDRTRHAQRYREWQDGTLIGFSQSSELSGFCRATCGAVLPFTVRLLVHGTAFTLYYL